MSFLPGPVLVRLVIVLLVSPVSIPIGFPLLFLVAMLFFFVFFFVARPPAVLKQLFAHQPSVNPNSTNAHNAVSPASGQSLWPGLALVEQREGRVCRRRCRYGTGTRGRGKEGREGG